jgi:outer membrane receptor protein involved in Fe transport
VLKAGVRFEYFDIGEQRLLDPRTPTDRIGRADNFENTPPKFYVSPRLGLSYPISERGAFRVAYGHFVQMSAYQEMLKNPVFNGINVGRLEGRQVGNPDLKPERTIKYELGLQQELTGFLGLDVNLFYKNVRNLLGVEILGTLDNVLYTRTINRDYGLIKGATLALVTRPMGRLLGTSFDVTYSDARGSSSNPFDVANVVVAGRSGEVGDLFFERQIIPLDWDQTLTINLAATVGKADDWSVGFISQVASGQPYTPAFLDPSKDFPDNAFTNAERKPLLVTFDLNAEKRFRVGATAAGVRLQVNNVLNYLNERVVDSVSGRADQIVRLEAVQNDRNEVLDFVNLFTRKDDDTHPHWFSSPRQVLFSLFFNF